MGSKNGIAIETSGLSKRYGKDVLAVDGVDLSVPAGTIYALLGPNGAGKTTTISILTTLIEPTAGSAKVAGFDVMRQAGKVRQRIGVTFQEMVLDDDLTGRQVLDYHGKLYRQKAKQRREKIAELLGLLELEDAANRRINTYSGGMKRRLELARGLMTSPEVLFLDEPTTGLDPQNRANIWDYIKNLKEQSGLTLLLTTHYMDEAEALADRVSIIDHGRIVVEGTPHELIDQMGADSILITGKGDSANFLEKVRSAPFVQALLVIAGLSCCIAMAMPQVHIVAYCVDLDYGAARGAEMLSLMLGFGVISRIASGAIADRIGGIGTLML
ncbi:MAG: ATP-binding cassette domain-containing protein, partial [Candidatus Thorarchaeota archaeon]